MKTVVLFLSSAVLAVAGGSTLNQRYAAWNYAAEIQVRNALPQERPAEIIDAGLVIAADHAANLQNDLRIVLKKGFDAMVKEIPCQIYDRRTAGGKTSFRVVFAADLPGDSTQRFGVFFDNPAAAQPLPAERVAVRTSPGGWFVESSCYAASFDAASGQCVLLQSKVPAAQVIYQGAGGAFPLPTIAIPAGGAGGGGPETLSGSPVAGQADQVVEGPVFSTVTGRRELGARRDGPVAVVEFTYVFFPGEPYFIVKSSLRFLRDAAVCAVEMNRFAAERKELTHYFFRPHTPTFPTTEIEEVGSIMVDAGRRKGFPDGDLLAGMLPADMVWQSVGNIDRGFAVTGFNLSSRRGAPEGVAPTYRPSTRARVNPGLVEWSNAPIYVGVQGRPSNAIAVRKGTLYEEVQAIYFSNWNKGDWRTATEFLGRCLNTAAAAVVFPKGYRPPDDLPVLPLHGERGAAYERSGIR